MGRWLFARHGQSIANLEGWISGHLDVPLTPLGRCQALELAVALRMEPISRAYCSDLVRAHETATLALSGRELAPRREVALRERHFGEWDGLTREALVSDGHWDTVTAWDARPPGGESNLDCARRVLAWLAEHDDGVPTLVVGHGSLFRCVLGVLDEHPRSQIGRRKVHNATLIARDVPIGRWAALRKMLGEPA